MFKVIKYRIQQQAPDNPHEHIVEIVTDNYELHVNDFIVNESGDKWVVEHAKGNEAIIINISGNSFHNLIGLWDVKGSIKIEKK